MAVEPGVISKPSTLGVRRVDLRSPRATTTLPLAVNLVVAPATPLLLAGMVTRSLYVPAATLTVLPLVMLSTAFWMVLQGRLAEPLPVVLLPVVAT